MGLNLVCDTRFFKIRFSAPKVFQVSGAESINFLSHLCLYIRNKQQTVILDHGWNMSSVKSI